MKLVRFMYQDNISYGILEAEKVRVIAGDIFGEWEKLIKNFPLIKLSY